MKTINELEKILNSVTDTSMMKLALAKIWCKEKKEELQEIFDKEKGIVSLNPDHTKKDVLIGVKELLGQ